MPPGSVGLPARVGTMNPWETVTSLGCHEGWREAEPGVEERSSERQGGLLGRGSVEAAM